MANGARGRWICTLMVTLTVLLGLESAALAYPEAPARDVDLDELARSLGGAAVPAVATAPARLLRGPHLVTRQARRLGVAEPGGAGPLVGPPVNRLSEAETQHLVSGTVLTVIASVLLANFLWMVIVGAVWLFGIYAPQASADSYFPPQAALFFVSFAFLVPGLILLPKGLKELKVYRAIQNAELMDHEPGRYLGDPRQALALRRGGLTLVRF